MAQSSSSAAGFAGSDTCRTCHPGEWANFPRNPHFRTLASGGAPQEQTGCEGCHGPGKAHVEASGGKNTIPRAFSLLSPAAVVDTCLSCHARDFGKANIRRSAHTLNNVACTSCHVIHRPATPRYLLAKKQSEVCYGCHAPVRAQFEMPSKHRVNEGFMECSDCHNPHGGFAPTWRMSRRPRMVEQALGAEEPCLKCHADKRGPFVFEHPPVRVEGCEICHLPHGSANSRLLRRPVALSLCLECHTGAGGFGVTSSGVVRQTPNHNLLDPKFQRCVACHVRIHGSNSSATFMR